eukprot:6212913-Pleurochrysis_carterae.AAC.2
MVSRAGGMIALHTYRPALRRKGSDSRPPEAQGGESMASVLPNRHLVDDDFRSWLTDNNESRKDGTQRTLRSVSRCTFPCKSSASMGMSSTSDTRCGLPSIPAMTLSMLRTSTRSLACECTCHVHPLSTTKVIRLRPLPRACRLAFWRSRPANRAREFGPRGGRRRNVLSRLVGLWGGRWFTRRAREDEHHKTGNDAREAHGV